MTQSQTHRRVRIASSGREFRARPEETLLTAALRQGIVLPYSCKNGTCSSCKCKLVDGTVIYPFNPPEALSTEDIASGHALACQAVATGDVTIEATEIEQVADIPVRTLPARVESMDLYTPQVMCLRLKLPRAARLPFLAGQYVDILLPGGKRRAFSIASPPSQEDFIELHVKHVAGGGFTGHVFDDMQPKEILRLQGPLGTFFVRRSSQRPMIMMGGGTGFAPLKAMIEELIEAEDTRPIKLYWGVSQASDLYASELIDQWQQERPNLSFCPVLTDPEPGWEGESGFVHEAVIRSHPDLSAFDIYMSGPPAMVRSARLAFLDAGGSEEHLFYDSFDFAPDSAAKVGR